MAALALWLKSKLVNNGLAIILVGILVFLIATLLLAGIDQLREKLGIETRTSLKVELQQEKQNTQTLTDTVVNLEKTIEAKEIVTEMAQQAIEEVVKEKEEVKQVVKKTIKVKKTKIKTIKATVTDTHELSNQVSEAQISSLWDSYCGFNSHSDCTSSI